MNQQNTTPTNQSEIPNYGRIDFEEDFCRNTNKIQCIADLLFSLGESKSQHLTVKGAFGLHYILEDAAKELRAAGYRMLEVDDAI